MHLDFCGGPMEHFSRELEEYRMLKHLFGATFSPSIANFCLKKTAELDGEGFEEQTVETVQRNMCVDDMMKSTNTTEKAVVLVSQLQELLTYGGFPSDKVV